MIKCLNCSIETTNPKFCSSSCSASYNNKLHPKRKPEGSCSTCGTPLTRRLKYCSKKCYFTALGYLTSDDWGSFKYGELKLLRKYQKNSRIREMARKLYIKSNKPRKCYICGYDKHFEVCHIKSISSHSDSTTIAEINSLSNLIALCPNCHWELDYGNLKLETFTT